MTKHVFYSTKALNIIEPNSISYHYNSHNHAGASTGVNLRDIAHSETNATTAV